MITCSLACVARVALVSQRNVLSIVEIIEGLETPFYPLVIQSLATVFILSKDGTDPATMPLHFKVSVDETLILQQKVDVAWPDDTGLARCVFEMAGFPLPKPGLVVFELLDGERQVGCWKFRAKQQAALMAQESPKEDSVPATTPPVS